MCIRDRYWAIGHGLGSLVGSGVMDAGSLDDHVPALSEALFVAAGDDPARCRRSVKAGWRTFATLMDGSALDHHGGAGPQGDVG